MKDDLKYVLYYLANEEDGEMITFGHPFLDMDCAVDIARATDKSVVAVTVTCVDKEVVFDARPPAVYESRISVKSVLERAAGSSDVVYIVASQMITNIDDLGDYRMTWEGTTDDSRLIVRLVSPTRVCPEGESKWEPVRQ